MTVTLDNPTATVELDAPTNVASQSFTSREAPWMKLGPQIDGDVNAASLGR